MSKENHSYTYVYLDPRKSGDFIYQRGIDEVYCFNYELIYVGKGIDDRIDDHISLALNSNKKHIFYNIIRKIYDAGFEPIRFKILQNVSEEEAFAEEISLISIAGRRNLGKGPLCNLTDGGEGARGSIWRRDLTGQQSGKLLIIKFVKKDKHGGSMWLCKCDCGNEKIIHGCTLKSETTKSCGCETKEFKQKSHISHDKAFHPLYSIWNTMMRSCYNINHRHYEKYSSKGIIVCKRWHEIENFINDMDNKPSDKHILGRIDTTKNFEPSNCKWMTVKERQNSKSNNRYLTIGGESKTLRDWAEISGTKYRTIRNRIYSLGWADKEAVFGK